MSASQCGGTYGLTGHIATPELARKFNAIFLANIGVVIQIEM